MSERETPETVHPPTPAPALQGENAGLPMDRRMLEEIVRGGMQRYFDQRRTKIKPFIETHYSFAGARRLHRKALGWDMLRAPANLAMAPLALTARIATPLAKRAPAPLRQRFPTAMAALDRFGQQRFQIETAVGRELQWRIMTELLGLPYGDGERESRQDALATTILSDPRLARMIADGVLALKDREHDPVYRARAEAILGDYIGSRVAAADIATQLMALAGGITLRQFTPGLLSLGPAVAQLLAQKLAIASFPLGAGVGGLWYGAFPAVAGPALMVGVTGGLLVAGSVFAAFAGALADPVLKGTGLHEKRLHRLIDGLERDLLTGERVDFTVRDHYLARVLDLLDVMRTLQRLSG